MNEPRQITQEEYERFIKADKSLIKNLLIMVFVGFPYFVGYFAVLFCAIRDGESQNVFKTAFITWLVWGTTFFLVANSIYAKKILKNCVVRNN